MEDVSAPDRLRQNTQIHLYYIQTQIYTVYHPFTLISTVQYLCAYTCTLYNVGISNLLGLTLSIQILKGLSHKID